ncbi:MAG: hypothetical protein JOZ83_13230 [Silvibacterium sp.]|nr:hypothetical protein [Silvibacterium sp.]
MNLQNNLRTQQVCLSDENTLCERCGGKVACEPWCETINDSVRYAHAVVLDANNLTPGDEIILHALGVRWTGRRNSTRRHAG